MAWIARLPVRFSVRSLVRIGVLLGLLGVVPPGVVGIAAGAQVVPVVASFSVLADLVARVGGDRVEVTSLVPAGSDTHVFQPGPTQARRLAGARLVVVNGLGFEGWLDRLVRASGYSGPIVVATDGLVPIPGQHNDGHSHSHGPSQMPSPSPSSLPTKAPDPHAWQSVGNVRGYVQRIVDGLCGVDAAGCDAFRANAARYDVELQALDGEIRAAIATIPADRRRVMTSHGAFAYYARDYGVTFLSPVGVSTDAEPSAASVARLIRQIRQQKVNAFFIENITDPRLIQRISDETGGAKPGRLYSDGLTAPQGEAADYLGMMRANTRALVAALARQ